MTVTVQANDLAGEILVISQAIEHNWDGYRSVVQTNRPLSPETVAYFQDKGIKVDAHVLHRHGRIAYTFEEVS